MPFLITFNFYFVEPLDESRHISIPIAENQKSLGFNLKQTEYGPHIIEKISSNSIASQIGLKEGDYLLRINGHNFMGKEYERVCEAIKEGIREKKLVMEVIDDSKCPEDIKSVKYF